MLHLQQKPSKYSLKSRKSSKKQYEGYPITVTMHVNNKPLHMTEGGKEMKNGYFSTFSDHLLMELCSLLSELHNHGFIKELVNAYIFTHTLYKHKK